MQCTLGSKAFDTGPLDALLAPGNPCAASALDIAPSKHPDFIFVEGVSQISQKKRGKRDREVVPLYWFILRLSTWRIIPVSK